ncbi:MAG: RNA methyltransferase [Spirochaetes bacterium]|nr:RNA methyltransferase [Spirochaetota bacterium]
MLFDVSALRDLQGKDLSGEGLLILEGRFLIEKAMDSGTAILGAIRTEESDSGWLESRHPQFPVEVASQAELAGIVGFKFHHGVLALAKRPKIPRFKVGAHGGAQEVALLCMWNITDPSNVGALIRSAAALSVSAVLLGPGCADPFYRKALRASMGNALSLPLYSCGLAELLAMRKAGIALIAATLSPRARPLEEFRPARPLALLLGNEGFGLPSEVIELCGTEVSIPMRPDVDSLNVVVAGGICMYELFRRR